MVLLSIYNNPPFGDFMSYPAFECYSQLQTLDALRAIFLSVLGGFMHGFKADSTASGNLRWLALVDEEASVDVERLAQGITGLRAYAYEYVAEGVRKGSLPISRVNRISREMIQFNRYIVYQADSAHGSQFPDFSYRQYPTENPHVCIYVFDLVAIQEIINNLTADGYRGDALDHIALIEDFRKAGMNPVEKDGVSASVRGQCALDLAS